MRGQFHRFRDGNAVQPDAGGRRAMDTGGGSYWSDGVFAFPAAGARTLGH